MISRRKIAAGALLLSIASGALALNTTIPATRPPHLAQQADSPLPTPEEQWWDTCPGAPDCPDDWAVQPTYTPRPLPTCLPTPTCPDTGASPTPYPTATPYPPQPTFPPPETPAPTPIPTALRPTPTPPPSGTTYYLDATDGDDTDTGTDPGAAWRTLPRVSAQFAAGAFLPGDRILLERGETWIIDADSRLEIAGSSGEEDEHIYVGAYGSGDPPLLDAAGNEVKAIVHRGWWNDANYITIEDLEITGVHDTGAVYLEDVHHWTLRNLDIHDVTAEDGGWAAAIRIRQASKYVRVENCTIARIRGEGIYLGTSEDAGEHTTHVTITGCDISYCDGEAVDFKDDTERCSLESSNLTMNGSADPGLDHTQISLGGQYNRVENCTISGTRDGNRSAVSLGRYSGGEVTDSGHHDTVENCTITGATGMYGAIHLVGQDNRITGCSITDSTYAVYGANTDAGLHLLEHNTFTGISHYPVYLSDPQSHYAFDYNRYDQANAIWYESSAPRDWAYVQALGQEANGYLATQ